MGFILNYLQSATIFEIFRLCFHGKSKFLGAALYDVTKARVGNNVQVCHP